MQSKISIVEQKCYNLMKMCLKHRINIVVFFFALAFISLSYRATNIAKITPIATITDAPTVPPTVAGKLSEGNCDNLISFVVSERRKQF